MEQRSPSGLPGWAFLHLFCISLGSPPMSFRPAAIAAFLFSVPAFAQTSYPMITHCTPVAVQRGTTTEVTVEGQMNFAGVYKVLFEGVGVSGEVTPDLPAPKGQTASTTVKSVKIRVRADPD